MSLAGCHTMGGTRKDYFAPRYAILKRIGGRWMNPYG